MNNLLYSFLKVVVFVSIVILELFIYQPLRAQDINTSGSLTTETFICNGSRQPFYFWTNRLGQVNTYDQYNLFTWFSAESNFTLANTNQALFAGILGNFRKAEMVRLTMPEIYGGYQNNVLRLTAGLFSDSLRLYGLSSSNGNFLVGQNSRPHPRVRIGTNRFIQLGKGNFAIAGFYEEGILNDHRAVKNPILHHKNLFFRHGTPARLEFTWGIEHFSFWSGLSSSKGKFPQKSMDYLRAVIPLPGENEDALGRKNVVGNQLGQYIFTFRKAFTNTEATIQLSHIFEDFSGMAFINYPDNMLTLLLRFRKSQFLHRFLAEYTYTLHQSGDDIDDETGEYKHINGRDNYLGHSEYSSGFTYDGDWMGSPLFGPIKMVNGVPSGPENNRFYAFHFGGQGKLFPQLEWSSKVTWSRHFGRYRLPYNPSRDQLYTVFQLRYILKDRPFSFDTMFGYDNGWLWEVNRSQQQGISFHATFRF